MDPVLSRNRRFGHLLTALAAIIGAAFAGYAWATAGSGVDHTGGALLVTGSSLLIFLAALALGLVAGVPRWLRGLLLVLLFLGIVCTAAAGYFLELTVLVGLMVVALLGWIVAMSGSFTASPQPALR